MNITKYIVIFATLLLAAGCDGTGISTKGDVVEYRVEDFAYADGMHRTLSAVCGRRVV
ncbi:MAG: hypothetical protein K2N31_03565 [Treponemataceae bacterium]|nr:hypothetical protein [Treponemataceae bacterium]